MSETRKNHLTIDGGQVKEEDHVASYKPIPETDTEFRSSKTSLTKSKEKVSPDGAEEKLLPKEQEAKIVTRVDMADAKYVVEDHRNGDAKIELDANKKQFSGLTKEELLKYADDPFWVNLRWFMFILFWAMWLCMLAGAITIIVRAPKCAAPEPKAWYEEGPLLDMKEANYAEIDAELPFLTYQDQPKAQALFVDVTTYNQDPNAVEQFQSLVKNIKELGIKVIVDLIPNYVSSEHEWFKLSENKTAPYDKYFTWIAPQKDAEGKNVLPNQWVSLYDKPAWSLSPVRNEYYLHQYEENQPDLDFNNEEVVQKFNEELKKWVKAGADGVRLNKARQMVVDLSGEESPDAGRGSDRGAVHTQYRYWRHTATSDLPRLDSLLATFSSTVAEASGGQDVVFTLEETSTPEYFRLRNETTLKPLLAAPLAAGSDMWALAAQINGVLRYSATNNTQWRGVQIKASSPEEASELAVLQLLLPAVPVLTLDQLPRENDNISFSDSLAHVASYRSSDASFKHGDHIVTALAPHNSTLNTLLVCARWKVDHTSYVGVYNSESEPARANLTSVASVPSSVTVWYLSPAAKQLSEYNRNSEVAADDIIVPPKSTIVLYYAPKKTAEQ